MTRTIERPVAGRAALEGGLRYDDAGEVVLRDLDIPVHPLARLAARWGAMKVHEAYPGLSPAQIQAAADFAAASPKPGRTRLTRAFWRAMADLTAAGVLDTEPQTPISADALR